MCWMWSREKRKRHMLYHKKQQLVVTCKTSTYTTCGFGWISSGKLQTQDLLTCFSLIKHFWIVSIKTETLKKNVNNITCCSSRTGVQPWRCWHQNSGTTASNQYHTDWDCPLFSASLPICFSHSHPYSHSHTLSFSLSFSLFLSITPSPQPVKAEVCSHRSLLVSPTFLPRGVFSLNR